jgi:hypothetical protein
MPSFVVCTADGNDEMKQSRERRQGSANSLRGPKQNAVRRPQKKRKPPSLKNQIRAIERLLKKVCGVRIVSDLLNVAMEQMDSEIAWAL